jgi:hypothetical protein
VCLRPPRHRLRPRPLLKEANGKQQGGPRDPPRRVSRTYATNRFIEASFQGIAEELHWGIAQHKIGSKVAVHASHQIPAKHRCTQRDQCQRAFCRAFCRKTHRSAR